PGEREHHDPPVIAAGRAWGAAAWPLPSRWTKIVAAARWSLAPASPETRGIVFADDPQHLGARRLGLPDVVRDREVPAGLRADRLHRAAGMEGGEDGLPAHEAEDAERGDEDAGPAARQAPPLSPVAAAPVAGRGDEVDLLAQAS